MLKQYAKYATIILKKKKKNFKIVWENSLFLLNSTYFIGLNVRTKK